MKPLIASLQNHCFENKKINKQLMSKTYWSVIEAKSFSINFRVTGRLIIKSHVFQNFRICELRHYLNTRGSFSLEKSSAQYM